MRHRCLTADQVARLLAYLVTDGAALDEESAEIIETAETWDGCVICCTLFMARNLAEATGGSEKIAMAYELEEAYAFEVSEGGDRLVDYLLHHQRVKGESLDDALISIHEGLGDHDYARALRY